MTFRPFTTVHKNAGKMPLVYNIKSVNALVVNTHGGTDHHQISACVIDGTPCLHNISFFKFLLHQYPWVLRIKVVMKMYANLFTLSDNNNIEASLTLINERLGHLNSFLVKYIKDYNFSSAGYHIDGESIQMFNTGDVQICLLDEKMQKVFATSKNYSGDLKFFFKNVNYYHTSLQDVKYILMCTSGFASMLEDNHIKEYLLLQGFYSKGEPKPLLITPTHYLISGSDKRLCFKRRPDSIDQERTIIGLSK